MAYPDDIDPIIESTETARGKKDPFATAHGEKIIALLNELKEWRETGRKLPSRGSHRVIVEGYSVKSIHDAFADAMDKAAHYFSEYHDVSITVLGLLDLPKGGHRATLEIHITPTTLKDTNHIEGQDVELERIHDRDYRKRKKFGEEHLRHLVYDHFASTSGGMMPDIPDYFLINIKDADLLNFMIEKAFFKAGRKPAVQPPAPTQDKIMVRIKRRRPKLPEEDPD